MDIVIDLTPILEFFVLPPDVMLARLLLYFGWIPFVMVFLWGGKEVWMFYIQNKWAGTIDYVFLAIDIPRANEQSPMAVDNIFAYLAGAHGTLNLIEVYWVGKFQVGFSFEIVSIEGYTQFIIRTPVQFRDLVESSIYSQYPDAEITEVDDYTKGAPDKFPDEEYDLWGADYVQVKPWVYPFRTYEDFEHNLGKDGTQYKDPMAVLMDLGSSLRKGEQLWFQIICVPQGFDWMEEGDKEISKILNEKVTTEHIGDKFVKMIIGWIGEFSEMIIKLWGDIEDKGDDDKDDALKMMNLKPKEKKQVEGISRKISKNGYAVKTRMIYLGRKEVFNKGKVVSGFTGFMKQFSGLDVNNFKPDMDLTVTSSNYFFKHARLNRRKNNIMYTYKTRDATAGTTPGIMNTEELASLWHFPLESAVKAPMIQKTPGKKSEPPMTLPVGEEIVSEEILAPIFEDDNFLSQDQNKNNLISGNLEDNKKNEIKNKKGKSEDFDLNEKKNDNNDIPPSNLPFV